MPEQELHPAATKFIGSLVKSLQILCNGQVEFSESIELIGHINVRVDRKYKFDYIVDEQVSKEGEDASTTFLSNSYHSLHPHRQDRKKISGLEQDSKHEISQSTSQNTPKRSKQANNVAVFPAPRSSDGNCNDSQVKDLDNQNYTVSVESTSGAQISKENQMVVKLEEDEDSNDCMVLPASPDDYEAIGEMDEESRHDSFPISGSSGSHESQNAQTVSGRRRKKRKLQEQGCLDVRSERPEVQTTTPELKPTSPSNNIEQAFEGRVKKLQANQYFMSTVSEPIEDVKNLISKLANLCNMSVVQDAFYRNYDSARLNFAPTEDLKLAKKKLLQSFDRDKIKKMKEVLKTKRGKRRKQELKSLIAESGLTNEQLLLLAQDAPAYQRKINWKSIPDGPDKREMLKEHRKSLRLKTQERQERLLEMAEMLKRNQMNEPGMTVVSKNGGRRCILNKSSVSVVSHNTQQLSIYNIDEAVNALTGKTKKPLLTFLRADKSKDQLKIESHKRHVVKRKMKQVIGKMIGEVHECGYRVIFTSTIGSDAGSHSAELSIVPLKVDEILPENKESDVKTEMTEEEFAKHLEREQFIEKQKANEEKMRDIEEKLTRVLTGVEEVFISSRKRYGPGETRPTDAERMKEYRKKLKEDPEKYQVYKQKRAMSKKRRRLSALAEKLKEGNDVTSGISTNSVDEETHVSQSIGTLVSITQPSVGTVSMHCPQVYGHPNARQPTASVVNVHHTNQFVGQVSGMHGGHQHQQSMSYGNEMDIVELIAATHNVQNQHFG